MLQATPAQRSGVLVGEGVLVGISVGVAEGMTVGVLVGVSVGVLVAVFVAVLVGVAVGDDVWVGVLVAVLVGVRVGVRVAVEVDVALGTGVSVPIPHWATSSMHMSTGGKPFGGDSSGQQVKSVAHVCSPSSSIAQTQCRVPGANGVQAKAPVDGSRRQQGLAEPQGRVP